MRSAATWGIASAISSFFFAILLAPLALAQVPAAGGSTAPATAGGAASQPSKPAQTAATQTDSAQPATQDPLPTAEPPGADDQGSMFVFKKQVEEVVLHATVVDEQGRLVTGLDKTAFSIIQN